MTVDQDINDALAGNQPVSDNDVWVPKRCFTSLTEWEAWVAEHRALNGEYNEAMCDVMLGRYAYIVPTL